MSPACLDGNDVGGGHEESGGGDYQDGGAEDRPYSEGRVHDAECRGARPKDIRHVYRHQPLHKGQHKNCWNRAQEQQGQYQSIASDVPRALN